MNFKKTVCSLLACLMLLAGTVTTFGAAPGFDPTDKRVQQIIPVLMYHNICESYSKDAEGANITPLMFRQHMEAILDEGYTPIFVKDYYDSIESDKKLPEKPIVITFDDGYLSNYEIAYPMLKELNIPATIFVVTSTVGEKVGGGKVSTDHFTWEQAREMQASGVIDIHSHSHTHLNMKTVSAAKLNEEIRLSKFLIEKNLGKECYVFSYPFGGYNDATSQAAKKAGYKMQILVNYAESGQDYLANDTREGLEHFTRLTVSGDMTAEDLFEVIDIAIENTIKLNGNNQQ